MREQIESSTKSLPTIVDSSITFIYIRGLKKRLIHSASRTEKLRGNMGNSTSKKQNACGPCATDSSTCNTDHKKRRRDRQKKVRMGQKEPVGIISHPYQQENPGRYQDEGSSSDEGDHRHECDEFDDTFLEPRGLFNEDSPKYSFRHHRKQSHPHSHRHSSNNSRLSTESLTYSESAASAAVSNASLSLASKPLSSRTLGQTGKNGIESVLEVAAPKNSKKSKGLFRGRGLKPKKKIEKENVPYEKTLSFVMDETYGKSPAREIARPPRFHGAVPDLQLDSAASEPVRKEIKPTHHRNSSIFSDSKLPTIADVSYQSSITDYEGEDNNEQQRNQMSTSNILSDLREDEYNEEDSNAGHSQNSSQTGKNEDGYRQLSDSGDNASMVSREYTVTTVEADELAYPYSATKNVQGLTNIMEERENINLILDRQHASYVEGDEPVKDIDMPTANLGNLFVNLTLNETLISKYHTLDHDNEIEQNTTSKDEVLNVSKGDEQNNESSDTSISQTVSSQQIYNNKIVNLGDGPSQISSFGQSPSGDDEFAQFVLDRTIIPNESVHRHDSLDDKDDDESSMDNLIQQESDNETSSADESVDDDSLLKSSYQRADEVLSNSSFEDSKMDDSLFQNNTELVNDILSDSSDEESENNESASKYNLSANNNSTVSSKSASLNQTYEDRLGRINNTLNRTDMAIAENILDRTDMAIVVTDTGPSDDDLLHDKENQLTRKCDASSASSLRSHKNPNRKNSPFPMDSNVAPTSSKLTNILPELSHDGSEEDLLFDKIESSDMSPVETNINADVAMKAADAVMSSDIVKKKLSSVTCDHRGPEIGTMIKLVQKTKTDDVRDTHVLIAENKLVATKNRIPAFSRQVANNAAFLFDGERCPIQLKDASKVDSERLSLLQKNSARRESTLSFPDVDIAEDDSLDTIQKKLMQFRKNNIDANSSNKRSSVTIYRSKGEIRINGEWPRKILSNSVDEEVKQTGQPGNSQKVAVFERLPKRVVNEKEKELSMKKSKKLDDHLSTNSTIPQRQTPEDIVSKASTNYDDISITDLQLKYTAITPMKTKSPHIRFKKALRMFDAHHEQKESTLETRKTPPRKNASAAREDFVFTKVTSINGRLRQNSQRSLKKKRRLTSGNDTIAPRKPTLVNPLFRNPSKMEYDSMILDDNNSTASHNDSNCIDSLLDNSTENMNEEIDNEVDDMSHDQEDVTDISGPYDETDEINLSPSSLGSNRSTLSDDEIVALMKAASVETSSPSDESPIRQINGLRSAMKKSRNDRNDSNRVSWFAPTDDQALSPFKILENSLAYSPTADSVGSSSSLNAMTIDDEPPMPNKGTFKIYSPSRGSVASPLKHETSSVISPRTNNNDTSNKENEVYSVQDSIGSISPLQVYKDSAAVIPAKRVGPVAAASDFNLSPGPGRRTSSQNRKWTKHTPTKKSWRELKEEHDSRKKKLSSKKKKSAKKQRLHGSMKKTSLFL